MRPAGPVVFLSLAAFAFVSHTSSAQSPTVKPVVLHIFNSGADDAAFPGGGALMQASDGVIYALGADGGANAQGTEYSYSAANGYQTVAPLTTQTSANGYYVAFTQATDGYLYTAGNGNLWRTWPGSTQQQIVATLPYAPAGATQLVPDAAGNLYGVTSTLTFDTNNTQNYLFAYNLASRQVTVLYTFAQSSDPTSQAAGFSTSSPVFGMDGKLYGTTDGTGCNIDQAAQPGCGTIWRINPDGTDFEYVHTFGNGIYGPHYGLTVFPDGDLYGVASGLSNNVVYKISTGTPVFTSLISAPIFYQTFQPDASGNSYVAFADNDGYGSIQFFSQSSGAPVFTPVVTFTKAVAPNSPANSLFLAADGNLYGQAADYTDNQEHIDNGSLYEVPVATTPLITLTGAATARPGGTVSLTYNETNNFGPSMNVCFLTDNIQSDTNFPVIVSASGTSSVPVPSAGGTYTYGFTCGGVQSATFTVTTGAVKTTTTLSGSTQYVAGQLATVNVTVAGTDGSAPDAGTVSLTCDGHSQGTHTVSGGTASFQVSTAGAAAGTHSCTASYSGDSATYYLASIGSGSTTIAAQTSSTQVQLSQSPVSPGQQETLTIVVTGQYATPTGSVSVTAKDAAGNVYPVAHGPINSGSAHFNINTSNIAAGTYTLNAAYSGDAATLDSKGSATVTVNAAATTTTLIVNPNPVTRGQTGELTATVQRTSGSGTPNGKVTFSADGYGTLGSAALQNGTAVLSINTARFTPGTYTVRASYSGDYGDQASDAAPVSAVINP